MTRLVARQSPLGTVVQALPRMRLIVSHMRPTWHRPEVASIDDAFVSRHDIRGILWDVDGTLTAYHADRIATECCESFGTLVSRPSLSHGILSNAPESRFAELGEIFPALPVFKGYHLNGALVLRTRHGHRDSWSPAELEAALAAGAVPIRKPSRELVLGVVAALDLSPADVVMVGDQYFTDIAGASMAGVRTIKVPTLQRASFPRRIRLAQHIECALFRLRHGRTH